MKEIENTLKKYPRLESAFGNPVRKYLKKNPNPLGNPLIQRLYMGDANPTAQYLDDFLKEAEDMGLNIHVPFRELGDDLKYASIIAEIRAGIWLKRTLNPEKIEFVSTTTGHPTPDLCLTISGKEQFVEVKSLHESDYFEILMYELEARCIGNPRFNIRINIIERTDFDNPTESPEKLSLRMKEHVNFLLAHVESNLDAGLPMEIEDRSLLDPFLQSADVKEYREPSIMSGPSDEYLLDEGESYCSHILSRGLLSRFVNQVSKAYWKLYEIRGSRPHSDRIVIVMSSFGFPFDKELRSKLERILEVWGISSHLDINIME